MFNALFFKNIVDLSSEAIIISDVNGVIVYVNQKALQLFRYEKEELLGKKIEVLIPRDSQDEHVKLRAEYVKNATNRPHGLGLDVYALRNDQTTFPTEVSLANITDNGKMYTVSIISNISKRKEKEQRIQDFIIEQQEVKKAHIKAQLEVLKNQISPHYLFNCLSILYTLIDTQPEKAQVFTKKILETYGYVLETKNKKWVTLDSEISFLKNYIYLQHIRFGDKFDLSIQEGLQDEEWYILPLSIQGLIENVFKHNSLSFSKKLKVSVCLKDEGVVVSNTITQKRYEEKSNGIGLKNLVDQYRLISSKTPKISADENKFEVWIPLFKNKV